jgi:methylenetetrahydrofolate reductase (NADPH)
MDERSIAGAGGDQDAGTLRAAVLRFLARCSVDTVPQNAAEVERYFEFLPDDRRIYVGQPPGTPLEEIVALVERLHGMGYSPIPQLAAREVTSEVQLRSALVRLRAAGVVESLVVAGDRDVPAGPFDGTLALLGTGLLADHGITTVGVAGYPEGNRLIGPTVLARSLADKTELAAACGWNLYIVTQLSFDPATVAAWIGRDAQRGDTVSIHVGLPGIGSLRELIGYSRRCGVGASMRTLVAKASSLPDSTALSTPAELVLAYAQWLARRPQLQHVYARFFTFSGLEQTARWVEQVRAGDFRIRRDSSAWVLDS